MVILILLHVFLWSLQAANENLTFEEQIVEAAKSIAAATGALIKAATLAQRELVAQGKVRQSWLSVYKLLGLYLNPSWISTGKILNI